MMLRLQSVTATRHPVAGTLRGILLGMAVVAVAGVMSALAARAPGLRRPFRGLAAVTPSVASAPASP